MQQKRNEEMTSWQDKFTAILADAKKDIDAAQLAYENGASKGQIEEYLKSARIDLKEASGHLTLI